MSDSALHKASKRSSADTDDSTRKKYKMEANGSEKKYNPYLAHLEQDNSRANNGYGDIEPAPDSILAGMKRRETTAKQATRAEDSDSNPFTGRPHSQKYFQILEKRRELPVHRQR